MRKFVYLMIAGMVIISMAAGCSKSTTQSKENSNPEIVLVSMQQKAAKTADEAIKFAKTLEGVQQKKDYLLAQAQSLYNSEELKEVVEIAKYVLEYMDNDAAKAKQLLNKATQDLEAMAIGGVDEAAKKIEGLKL